MEWRSLPETGVHYPPAQWVGCVAGEDVAWIVQWRYWGDVRYRWTVETSYGTAFGLRLALHEAQHSAESVLLVYGIIAAEA